MRKREKTETRHPSLPTKGASTAEIKAWIAKREAQMTPKQRTKCEKIDQDLKEIFKRVGFDPVTRTFPAKERCFEVDLLADDPLVAASPKKGPTDTTDVF